MLNVTNILDKCFLKKDKYNKAHAAKIIKIMSFLKEQKPGIYDYTFEDHNLTFGRDTYFEYKWGSAQWVKKINNTGIIVPAIKATIYSTAGIYSFSYPVALQKDIESLIK